MSEVEAATTLDRSLRPPIGVACIIGAATVWLARLGPNSYLIATALTVAVLVIATTSLSTYRSEKGSSQVSTWRLVAWLLILTSIPFVLFRAPLTLLLLAFRDSPPPLLDRLSSFLFLLSALILFVALVALPFRRSSRVTHHRFIWALLVALLVSSLVQTALNG